MSTTRQRFEHELSALHTDILEMAGCADEMVARAVQALIEGDTALAETVVSQDDVVDQFDLDIERKCLLLLVREQPVARDLRVVGTALKIISDIERIGDYAVDIARIGQRLVRAGEVYRPVVDLPHLTHLSRTMLHEALLAFAHQDLELVAKVIRDDDEVDRIYKSIRDQVTRSLLDGPERGLLLLNVMFAAKYLERISDHVVNIAERVAFIENNQLRTHLIAAAGTDTSA